MTPAELPTHWRALADTLTALGAAGQAQTARHLADELEAALRAEGATTLTLQEAALESGYSADRLRHLVSDGTIPNAGRPGSPRIRRADLPRKAVEGTPRVRPIRSRHA